MVGTGSRHLDEVATEPLPQQDNQQLLRVVLVVSALVVAALLVAWALLGSERMEMAAEVLWHSARLRNPTGPLR